MPGGLNEVRARPRPAVPGPPSRPVPDVPLARVTPAEHVGHAAGGLGGLGGGLGVAHVHAHHGGRGEGAPHVLLRLGEHDVHLDTPIQEAIRL